MYEVFGYQFRERKLFLEGTHPLIQADLVEILGDYDDIILTDTGKHLFLEMTIEYLENSFRS